MNITEIKIFKLENNSALALASITINAEFVVTGLTVRNGQNGYWVSMPSRKNKEGEYNDIAFPITKDARKEIQDAVLSKYHEESQTYEPVVKPVENREQVVVSEDDLPF